MSQAGTVQYQERLWPSLVGESESGVNVLSVQENVRTKKWIQESCRTQNNTQKSVEFVNINNKLSEKKLRKQFYFKNVKKKIKNLEINLTKEVKDLYTENKETLIEESGKDTNKMMSQVYGLEEFTLLKY